MPMLRALRLLNSIEAGTTSGAQLETLLADAGRQAEFNTLLGMRGNRRRIIESTPVITTMAGSARASNLLVQHPDALSALIYSANKDTFFNSATAMASVATSTPSLGILFGSVANKEVLYDSTAAFTAFTASANAKAYMVSIAQTRTTTSTSHDSVNTGKTFFVQQKIIGAANSHAGASADTYSTASIAFVDRFVKLTGLTHRSSNSLCPSTCTYIDMD